MTLKNLIDAHLSMSNISIIFVFAPYFIKWYAIIQPIFTTGHSNLTLFMFLFFLEEIDNVRLKGTVMLPTNSFYHPVLYQQFFMVFFFFFFFFSIVLFTYFPALAMSCLLLALLLRQAKPGMFKVFFCTHLYFMNYLYEALPLRCLSFSYKFVSIVKRLLLVTYFADNFPNLQFAFYWYLFFDINNVFLCSHMLISSLRIFVIGTHGLERPSLV